MYLSVVKDRAIRWTHMVIFYSEASFRKSFIGEITITPGKMLV